MTDKADDAMTDQEILNWLNDFSRQGLFDYVLPTEPLGEEWIVGMEGQIIKMTDKAQVMAFISGCNGTLRFFAKRAGLEL